jgi:hypothetical protein
LPPGDLELDGGPVPGRARAIDAAAPDPFARFEIGVIVEALDKAAGVGRDCRFPSARRRINLRNMANLRSTNESTT